MSRDILHLVASVLHQSKKQGLAMRLGKKDGSVAALLRNQLIFWSIHPARGSSLYIFCINLAQLFRKAFSFS